MSKLDELLRELCPNGVKYKKLVDAVSIERGKRVVRSQLSIRGKYPVYQNSLTPLGYHTDYNYNANTTFIIVAGAAGLDLAIRRFGLLMIVSLLYALRMF